MRRTAELYAAWMLGVLCAAGLAYWYYLKHYGEDE